MHGSRPARRSRTLLRMTIAIAVTTAALGVSQGTAQADPLEDAFALDGGQSVAWKDGRTNGCDDGGAPTDFFTLVYPEDIGTGSLDDQPIIVWGNGTDGTGAGNTTCSYRELLEHWASWGFVVIAPNIAQSGTGDEMRFGAQAMINANNDNNPSNVFYQNLDTSSIAAAGHSQGALGAINATLEGNGMFTSVLAMSTPDRDAMEIYNDPYCEGTVTAYFCCEGLFGPACVQVPMPDRVPDMNNLGAPIFFVRGSFDVISNETASDWFPTATVPYAEGSRNGTGHFDLTNATGYMTAWLGYTLDNNAFARAAFVGNPPGSLCNGAGIAPEILCNDDWDNDPPTLANLS